MIELLRWWCHGDLGTTNEKARLQITLEL
eukprot:COSAG05_NODE_24212_length_253_cov_0.655844_1_plen_28_part_10